MKNLFAAILALGEIDSDEALNILDEDLNVQVVTLERIQ